MIESKTGRLYSAWSDVDPDADGIQRGDILVAQSTDRSAYQALRVPFMSIRHGKGPSTLLMAGNHGDEPEGQVVLSEIAGRLELASLKGRILLLPRANTPACAAGTRTSPADGGNLNTAFPGVKGGGATAQIAHFIEESILPRIDLWIDLHSGGRTLIYEPLAAMHVSTDRALNRETAEQLRIFGAGINLVFTIQEARAASSAAQRHGVKYLYGEFGGGATGASREGIAVALAGVERVLAARHQYVPRSPAAACADPLWCRIDATDYRETRKYYFFAPGPGIWVAGRDLGSTVANGDVIGRLYSGAAPFAGGVEITARAGGRLVCLRSGAVVETGDCLGHLAQPATWSKIRKDYC